MSPPLRSYGFLAFSLPFSLLLISPASAQSDTSPSLQGRSNLQSSNTGLNVNNIVGADRFYAAGYTGTNAVITSIDAGHIWNGHETLSQVTTFLDASQTNPANTAKNNSINGLGSYDSHGTWVGHTLAGRNNPGGSNYTGSPFEYKSGIAYGAALWSGAIATSWVNSLNFNASATSFVNPYYRSLILGVNGRTTDVINSSLGYPDPTGISIFTGSVDGMARESRRTVVQSAGNSGAGTNKIGGAASGYNTIAVGATGTDTSNPAYSTVSGFSSQGPQDYQTPGSRITATGAGDPSSGTVVSGARARVDIVAPGQNLTLAYYGGATGGNAGGSNNTSPNLYSSNVQGTSFAAPTVAGSAALLVDAARSRYAGTTLENALDGEVIKAVLLNSTDKLTGWNNGQTTINGVTQTTQALDYAQGAGSLNLERAFDQYLGGVQDVAGSGGGIGLGGQGWDYGTLSQGLFSEYVFDQPLLAGSRFTATLNWFVNTRYAGAEFFTSSTAVYFDSFTDLYMELYRVDGGTSTLVARSDAAYLNTEHFYVTLADTASYKLRVGWGGERYDYVGNTVQSYGLAWSGVSAAAAPEPGDIVFVVSGLGSTLLAASYRRRQQA